MKKNDNELLIIQTSDSSAIYIKKDFFPYDDPEIEELCYSICEGYNPLYWLQDWYKNIEDVLNILEFPQRQISVKRDYISWWLNCKPRYINDSIIPLLRKKLENYHLTGEITNAFINARNGLEFNANCIIEWHKILNVEFNEHLIKLIPDESTYDEQIKSITIFFEGFEKLPIKNISLKIEMFDGYFNLRNYISQLILNEEEIYENSSYPEFILYNTNSCEIIRKNKFFEFRSIIKAGINEGDKIICYKKL
jgi:hypothetical protein